MELQVTCERTFIADVACLAEQQAKMEGERSVVSQTSQGEHPTVSRNLSFFKFPKGQRRKSWSCCRVWTLSEDMNETNAGEVAAAV
jgi:hypothetical protein